MRSFQREENENEVSPRKHEKTLLGQSGELPLPFTVSTLAAVLPEWPDKIIRGLAVFELLVRTS